MNYKIGDRVNVRRHSEAHTLASTLGTVSWITPENYCVVDLDTPGEMLDNEGNVLPMQAVALPAFKLESA